MMGFMDYFVIGLLGAAVIVFVLMIATMVNGL